MNDREFFTADEFVSLAVEIAVEQGFVKDADSDRMHPEDLFYQLEPIMRTIAATVTHVLAKQRGSQ